MSQHDDTLYLVHIDETAELIRQTALLRGRRSLELDVDLRDATMYRLQALAESTQRLSKSFKDSHPEIPWQDIAGFRNRAVHAYLGIDLDIVWDIVQRDVPAIGLCARQALDVRRERELHHRDPDVGMDIGF